MEMEPKQYYPEFLKVSTLHIITITRIITITATKAIITVTAMIAITVVKAIIFIVHIFMVTIAGCLG